MRLQFSAWHGIIYTITFCHNIICRQLMIMPFLWCYTLLMLVCLGGTNENVRKIIWFFELIFWWTEWKR